MSGRRRHQDRTARPKERTEPGARCGSPAARLVVDIGADRHSGIDQLGKTRRQLGTVLQPLIGERRKIHGDKATVENELGHAAADHRALLHAVA